MNWWNLIVPVLNAVIAYVFYCIGFRRGFRAGEKQGAQTVVAHVMGLKGDAEVEVDSKSGTATYKDFSPARYYDELEEQSETGGVRRQLKDAMQQLADDTTADYQNVRNFKRYGHDE